MGSKWAQKIQLGPETVAGTAVPATSIWRGVGGNLQDNREVTVVDEQIGLAQNTTRNYIAKLAAGLEMAATPATFEQLPHILEAGVKAVGTGAVDGSGTDKIYAYPFGTTSANTIKTYTIETGDDVQAEEMEYSFVESFTLSGERGQAVMMSANWVGRQITKTTFTGALSAPAVDEILTGNGTFYVDAVSGTVGTTAKTSTLLSWELSVDTGRKAKWTVDKGQLYFDFAYLDLDSFNAEFGAVLEHNVTSVAIKDAFVAGTPQLVQIKLLGPTVATPGTAFQTKALVLSMPLVWTSVDALDADEGNSILAVTGRVGYDTTDATGLVITVVNELASIP